MKKLALYGLAMLLAVAGFSSCEKEKEDTNSSFSVEVDKIAEFPRTNQKLVYSDYDSMEILLHDRVDSLLIVLNPDFDYVQTGRYELGITERYNATFTVKGATTADNKLYYADSGYINLTEIGKRVSGEFSIVMVAADESGDALVLSNGVISNILISDFEEEDEE